MTAPSIKEALKPCPFCGGKPELLNGGPGNWFVRCTDCKCTTNDVHKDAAVQLWHRRAALANASAEARPREDAKPRKVATLQDFTCDKCDGTGLVEGPNCCPQCLGEGSYEEQIVVECITAQALTAHPHATRATFQPDGERREAIARALERHDMRDYGWTDKQFEVWWTKDDRAASSREQQFGRADMLLASGLVQDEAGIRADEREKCIRDMQRAYPEHAWLNAACASIRSARDGGER